MVVLQDSFPFSLSICVFVICDYMISASDIKEGTFEGEEKTVYNSWSSSGTGEDFSYLQPDCKLRSVAGGPEPDG
jgi:hypothetical protein